jgi:BNR repeat-like domain
MLRSRPVVAIILLLLGLIWGPAVSANVAVIKISQDPFTNSTSQHATQVEPDTFSNGSTIVSTFQSGRFFDGGASDIMFATSTNSGALWVTGQLPGITTFSTVPGQFDRVSDPSVAFDASHNIWLISSLPLVNTSGAPLGAAVLVSRSTDGGSTWSNPVTVASATGGSDLDKNWTVCDNTPTSPFFGSCYTQYDDFGHNNQVHVAFSRDGGQTWTEGALPRQGVIGGQPVVQPNGTVIMPIDNAFETAVFAFRSTDGGVTWTGPVTVARIRDHNTAGGLRSGPLPSAEIDAAGKVYVVWSDCRFRRGCKSNDLVMSTSTDGLTWSAPARIPIDATTSTVDHFLPGLAVDRSTSGSTAHLGLTYYFYPNTACTATTCQLTVGFISSTDGGATWGSPTQLQGPMALGSLADTSQGRMVGDYISTSFAGGLAHGVFAVANPPANGVFDEAMYTPTTGLAATSATAVANDPVLSNVSDHADRADRSRRR